jgi:hypothetical protein
VGFEVGLAAGLLSADAVGLLSPEEDDVSLFLVDSAFDSESPDFSDLDPSDLLSLFSFDFESEPLLLA